MAGETAKDAQANLRWTSRDLELFPDNGKRYEIVDGELDTPLLPGFSYQLSRLFAGIQ